MVSRALRQLGCGVALVAASLVRPSTAEACCPAFAADSRVAIANQEILIVWDEARHTEHFVRRAGFETASGRDFGFLVPTPTQPALAEAASSVFDALAQTTAPVPRPEYEVSFMPLVLYPLLLTMGRKSDEAATATASAVQVLHRQTVAGYDAVVLEADDAEALARWLRDNGYDARPEIAEWARPYVAARWKITAFKYAGGERQSGAEVATSSVRLSFATDRPLFPYRVPTDQLAKPGAGHLLRVFFVSDGRFDGALGPANARWNASTNYAAPVDGLAGKLAGAAPAESLEQARWLTVFDDSTWPGGTEDLFFSRSKEQSKVIPTYAVPRNIPLPLDVLAAVGFVAFRIRKRRRRG